MKKTRTTFEHKKVKREERLAGAKSKRRKLIFKIILLLSVIIAVCYLTYQSPLFSITKLEVRGNSNLSEGQILKAAALPKKSSYFDFPAVATKRRIESLVWVEKAVVYRKFPGVAVIQIKERKPFIYLTSNGLYYVVDFKGFVINAEPFKKYKIPLADLGNVKTVVGKSIDGDNFKNLISVYKGISPAIRSKIYTISSESEDELSFIINGVEVFYGTSEKLKLKNKILEELIKKNKNEQLSLIDLRVPSRPVVRVVGK